MLRSLSRRLRSNLNCVVRLNLDTTILVALHVNLVSSAIP